MDTHQAVSERNHAEYESFRWKFEPSGSEIGQRLSSWVLQKATTRLKGKLKRDFERRFVSRGWA